MSAGLGQGWAPESSPPLQPGSAGCPLGPSSHFSRPASGALSQAHCGLWLLLVGARGVRNSESFQREGESCGHHLPCVSLCPRPSKNGSTLSLQKRGGEGRGGISSLWQPPSPLGSVPRAPVHPFTSARPSSLPPISLFLQLWESPSPQVCTHTHTCFSR